MAVLEFMLDAADVPRLGRWPGMKPNRSFPTDLVWHDTPEAALASDGRGLCIAGGQWRVTSLHAPRPAMPEPLLYEAKRPEMLGMALPQGLAPVARWQGRRQSLRWAGGGETVALQVMEGNAAGTGTECRLTLEGPATALPCLAIALAADLAMHVPRAGIGQAAMAAARGEAVPPRALGAPQVHDRMTVSDSLAVIMGHLLDVMLHWGAIVPTAKTPEAVHQMRVATRRLRSALSIYKQAAACPEVAGLSMLLKLCAARLGTARDWDVFIGGLGARLAETFPGDPRCAAMMRAAVRRQRQAYSDLRGFLAGPDYRTLTVAVACAAALRPWDAAPAAEGLQQDTAIFAAGVLSRRMKRVRQAGRGIEGLSIPALHELRKDCKRLRYAAEFFASLFPAKRTKRFLMRLAALQEELGLLNDSAAVSGLMAQLGRLERSYAAGLVEGFSAAHAGPARDRIMQAWTRFRREDLFWTR